MRHLLTYGLAILLGVGACATSPDGGRAVSYSTNAKENYERGQKQLKGGNWLEAIKYFSYVRTKFGFSKWASLAELGIADADMGREKYAEAIDGYRAFIKSHPTHDMVQNGYAAYKIGEAYYKQIPSQWFLVPAAYEKDQGPVRDALRELTSFSEQYADSPYMTEARKRIDDCTRRLADHELYVARFYMKRHKPLAAISRLETLVREYPRTKLEADVLLMLGQIYLDMEKPREAKRTFERLTVEHPDDYRAKKAQLYLDHIARRFGNLAESSPPAAPSEK